MAQTTLEPIALEIAHAQDCTLYDTQGKGYVDLIAGISVSSLGHQNECVKQAITAQLNRNMHVMVYGEVIHDTTAQFSKALSEKLPESLNNVYFVNSGSEAVDAAMKLAKRITGRPNFIAQKQAYHGSSQGPLSLMSDPYFTQRYRPLLNQVTYIAQNDMEAVQQLPKEGAAALILELIQAERGAKVADMAYIKAVREYCKRTNTLLIIDEIQTGLYRTGSFMAFEHFGITPDILVLGKAVGGGMPLACMVTSTSNMRFFASNPILGHITTFGGHPVCAAAGLANLQELDRRVPDLSILEKEELFRSLLKHPKITEVTGMGLLLACHIDSTINIIEFNKQLLSKGVFTDWFLFNQNAIRIAPPLIISLEEIRYVCETITDLLNSY